MGPGDPRPRRRRPLRGQDPRLGARVHGQAAPGASSLTPTRGWRRPPASWSAPRHTAESLWAALPDVPRPARRRPAWARPASTSRSSGRSRRAGREPAGRLRRQADRLQGGRPAAGRLAAGPRRAPRGAAPGRRLRRVRGRACGGCWRRSSAATSRTPARSPRRGLGPRGRGGEAAADPLGLPRRPAAGLRRGGPRPLPARSSSSAGSSTTRSPRCCRGAEALVMPSTFPEAFGMVAAEAAACGALPVSAGHSGMLEVSRQLAAALPPEVGRLTSFPVEPGAVEAIADRLNALARRCPEAERRRGPRDAGRDRRAALELGGRGPRRARRRGRRPGELAAPVPLVPSVTWPQSVPPPLQ